MSKATYTIRPPWPDELPRVKLFLTGFKPEKPFITRIAVAGRWERIIGVAAKEENASDDKIWLKLRPKYINSNVDVDLRRDISSLSDV